ncbi:MAG: cupin domain-containing protein [Bacteroidia bacterium]|nr:cupin domain-containing protein [Bacteroidia bacterium]
MILIEKPSEEKLLRLKVNSWPVWEKEISEFLWKYDETETCYIIEGEVVVTPVNGNPVEFGKGDLVVFSEGLKCKWKIIKAVRKHYKFG